jgi:hypothetical protein
MQLLPTPIGSKSARVAVENGEISIVRLNDLL